MKGVDGFDKDAFEEVHSNPKPVVSVRVNPFKETFCGMTGAVLGQLSHCERVPWCDGGFYLGARPSFTLDPLFHAGAYYVQEASSMFLWYILKSIFPNKGGVKVLDACAAPGGKSTLLASYFNEGLIVANETIRQRAQVLVENTVKWGAANFVVTQNDPAHFASLPGFFDLVVVDAPCSGSGLFRKDAGSVEEWSPENVYLCCQRQKRILHDVMPCLAEGGVLIYSTCSYSKEEDEDICSWLVYTMGLEPIDCGLPNDLGIVATNGGDDKKTGYRFYPYSSQGEGFFMAAFRKTDGVVPKKWQGEELTKVPKGVKEAVGQKIDVEPYYLFMQNDCVRAFPFVWKTGLLVLANSLYIKKAGIGLMSFKGADAIPNHELAMSVIPFRGYNDIILDEESSALDYLRKKDVKFGQYFGWNTIKYCGLALGWVKVMHNRQNNYYPNDWRILIN